MASTNLATLFPDSRFTQPLSYGNPYNVIYIYNTSTNAASNGGQCCLWTVPSGATWAKFEVWGGGGGGGGSCCCQQQCFSGGSGSYARKTIQVVPTQQYTICAGGSTGCSSNCNGGCGYASYACNATASYPLCLCASGGFCGVTGCFFSNNSCGAVSCQAGSACGFDLAICGLVSGAGASTCGYMSWDYGSEPTYIGAGVRMSLDQCGNTYGDARGGCASFPGGGGSGASANGGNCYQGGHGAGGLVIITYK